MALKDRLPTQFGEMALERFDVQTVKIIGVSRIEGQGRRVQTPLAQWRAGYNAPGSGIAGTFNAHSIGVSCTLFDKPATYAWKRKFRTIPAISRSAFEPVAEAPANPLRLTDRTALTIESGVTALAEKGMMAVAGGRG
jgi:hypothetical protein